MTPEPAGDEDLDEILALLQATGLPTAGVGDQFPAAYSVIRNGPLLAAVAGLERYGDAGLLRSVAVLPAARGRGLARALVHDRIAAARVARLSGVYLLTTTAPELFRRLGFSDVDRTAVPPSVRAAPEFAAICPATAVCLGYSTER